MKIIRFLSFTFITILILPLIYFTFFFDSENFRNSIANYISNKIPGDIKFDNEIDLIFFPNPKIVLNNLVFLDKKVILNVANTEINSKWISFLRGDFKFKNLKFLYPTLSLNLKTINHSEIYNNYFLHANVENNSKFFDQYFRIFEKIEIKNGILKIFSHTGEYNLEKADLLFNNTEKQISGTFSFKNLNSDFSFEARSKSENYESMDVSIEQKILNHKEKIFLDGVLSHNKKFVEFNGLLKSKNLNMSKLIQNSSQRNTGREFLLKKVKYSSLDFLKIKINAKIDKLEISNQILNNVTFNSFINSNVMKVEKFNSSYLGGILKANVDYSRSDNRIKGVLFFEDFSLPLEIFGKTKYDISGGKNTLSSSFESFFLKLDFQSLIRNLNLIGKLEINNADLYGINLEELSKKIDNFTGINDIFEILKLSKNSKESNIDSIKSDFTIDKNELKFDNLISRNSYITVYSSGIYFLNTRKIDVSNEIKIKSKKLKSFPTFNVTMKGSTGELDYIYDFKNVKEYLISRSLNKLLKKNNQKFDDFETFLDFFID